MEKMENKPNGRINVDDVVFIICDIQDYCIERVYHYEDLLNKTTKLLKVCDALKIPVIVTQHYKQKYNETIKCLKDVYPKENLYIFDKNLYSVMIPEVESTLKSLNRRSVFLVGIDAHICVLQTVFDLIDRGYEVHPIVDGISCTNKLDRTIAFKRMEEQGAYLSTFELLIFEMMKDQLFPKYDEVYQIFKEPNVNNPFIGL
jgi:nicotinamidase-related amidase